MRGQRSILIDTDIAFGSPKADADDVLGLMLALTDPGLRVAAITPVGGNVSAERASLNLHGFLSRVGLAGLPHAWSQARPLDPRSKAKARLWDREESPCPKPDGAPSLGSADLILATLSGAPAPMTVVAIGPLTNLGMALAMEPAIAAKVDEVVMMGGSKAISGLNGLAEFNVWVDPIAAAIVFDSGLSVRVFGLDVTKKRKVRPEDLDLWGDSRSALVREARESALGFMRYKSELFGPEYGVGYLHDAFPFAYFREPGLFAFEPCRVRVGLDGGSGYGVTSFDPSPADPAHPASLEAGPHLFASAVDAEAATEHVIGAVAGFGLGR